ncbi:MAG: ABC transporter permease [Chloroflexota bacterium]|nr:ABC transporter permease [Chloroflexota bacterium]
MTAASAAVTLAPTRASRGLWRDALTRLRRNRPALLGIGFIAIFVGVAVLAPLLAPYDPNKQGLGRSLAAPSAAHLAGLDKLGRDELSRVIFGARISLFTGVISVIIGLTLGGIIGALAGGIGGKVDTILMRIVDVLLAVPGILLAIGIVAWLGQGLPQIMLAVAVSNAPTFARLLRGSLLALRETDYVIAGRSLGATGPRILVRHMLPNALSPLIVAATLALATAIIDVAGLGFLGLGPPDPRTPEWGTMLTDATELLRRAPNLVFAPGVAIVISAIGFNLLGDGLRESLDPRLKR